MTRKSISKKSPEKALIEKRLRNTVLDKMTLVKQTEGQINSIWGLPSHPSTSIPCLFRSQMRRVLSRDAETSIKLPLGVKLRSLTTSWWPERFKSRSPSVRERGTRSGGDEALVLWSWPHPLVNRPSLIRMCEPWGP